MQKKITTPAQAKYKHESKFKLKTIAYRLVYVSKLNISQVVCLNHVVMPLKVFSNVFHLCDAKIVQKYDFNENSWNISWEMFFFMMVNCRVLMPAFIYFFSLQKLETVKNYITFVLNHTLIPTTHINNIHIYIWYAECWVSFIENISLKNFVRKLNFELIKYFSFIS